MTRDIVDQMARTFWVNAWAQSIEEEGGVPAGPGEDLMDAAPPTHWRAYLKAWTYVDELAEANQMTPAGMYRQALVRAALRDTEAIREKFGHYVAMEALGHGVSWRDDHPEGHGIEVPLTEFMV